MPEEIKSIGLMLRNIGKKDLMTEIEPFEGKRIDIGKMDKTTIKNILIRNISVVDDSLFVSFNKVTGCKITEMEVGGTPWKELACGKDDDYGR